MVREQVEEKTGLLVGINAAAEFLKVSRTSVYKYIRLGMPAFPIPTENGRVTWHFYKDNIERFWQQATKKPVNFNKNFIEEEDTKKKTLSRKI